MSPEQKKGWVRECVHARACVLGKLRENGALRDDSMIKIHPKPSCLCEKL